MSALSIFSYLPLSYLFRSRLLTVAERISWVVIYPVFLLLAVYLSGNSIFRFFISFLGVMSIYEVGYLYNDFVTTKRETNPTIRYSDGDDFYKNNFKSLVFVRYMLTGVLSVFEFFLYKTCYLALFSISILLTYYFHNTVRSRINVVTYFFLVLQRYIAPVFFVSNIFLFLLVILLFPFPRTLEHACKIKYSFTLLQDFVGDPDKFRVKYYFLVMIGFSILYFTSGLGVIYLLLPLYFFSYRFFSYLIRNKVKRQKHSAYGD